MKKLSVLFAAVMMFVSMSIAKAQKVATVDVEAILSMMPEKKKADEQLLSVFKAKQAEIQKQAQTWQEEVAAYQKAAATMTEAQRTAKEGELQKKQQNIQQMSEAAQKDYTEKQQAAYAPIDKKFMEATEKAAKANGWDFIFDSNTMGLIYKGGADATAAVKKELGL
ncbi:OmpH family outer membrane protein [Riemerella anatipestifer]|uniref:OmpH family outer membrane protein n=1 Tax=Riemerella anatipestifer TaxID=34085 RepID=UPI00069ACCB9|nr:OmpH family outer membrane protein [Riemerella anatipestifer]MBO4233277.1 OmpH family outer membrane protein [Riemerella anatipestifer]MDY3316989.1 OmpH family outer membrane protein [Riemerella anatipestifer]MDY3318536.1 OmpH family outer membrane protein [Riemerella anatipestifer]MDY3324805.1 OmpH family outer membrane protein [Riemerella anatipestifer]MDY3350822.1 OmpH family outer membrane protein [Riemerella anatipestifer]